MERVDESTRSVGPSEAGTKGARRLPVGALLVGLPMLFLVLFFYYPLGRVFVDALGQDWRDWETSPLWQTLQDEYFWRLLSFTAKQAFYSMVLSIALGLPLAYILANYRFPFDRTLRSLTLVPFVLPTVAVGLGFILFFGQQGPVNQLWEALFGERLQILYSLQAIVLAHAFYNAPVVTRTVLAAWERLDPSYEESARSLGSGRFAVFRRVTLPLILPGLVSGSLLAFIFSYMSFPIVLTLGGARFSTLEVEVYTQVRVLLNYSGGAAVALVQTLFSLLFAYIYLQVENRLIVAVPGGRERPKRPLFRLRPLNGLLILYLVALIAFYTGPVLYVLLHALGGPGGGEWSFEAFRQIVQPTPGDLVGERLARATLLSLRYAAGTVLVALPLGAALALGLSRRRFLGRRFLEALALTPLAVSSIAFGFGLLQTFRTGLFASLGTGIAIVVAHSVLAFPFVVRTLRPTFERLDRSLREAARSLGANGWRAFRDVELPLALGGLLVAAVFAFALSIAEMTAVTLLASPQSATMPLLVYQLLSSRNFQAASAMAVVLMFLAGLAFFIMERLGERLVMRAFQSSGRGEASVRSQSDIEGGSARPDVFGM